MTLAVWAAACGWPGGRCSRKPGIGSRIIGAVLFLVGAAVFVIGVLVVVVPGDMPVYQLAGALVIFGSAVMIAMIWLIGAPTQIGAKVLTDIEGFKLYLETAETNRLNMRDAPEMSEELFERFLPYAAGLGVEKTLVGSLGRTIVAHRAGAGGHLPAAMVPRQFLVAGQYRGCGGVLGCRRVVGDGGLHARAQEFVRFLWRRLVRRWRWRRWRRRLVGRQSRSRSVSGNRNSFDG